MAFLSLSIKTIIIFIGETLYFYHVIDSINHLNEKIEIESTYGCSEALRAAHSIIILLSFPKECWFF